MRYAFTILILMAKEVTLKNVLRKRTEEITKRNDKMRNKTMDGKGMKENWSKVDDRKGEE